MKCHTAVKQNIPVHLTAVPTTTQQSTAVHQGAIVVHFVHQYLRTV
jgi:hypothetical protein